MIANNQSNSYLEVAVIFITANVFFLFMAPFMVKFESTKNSSRTIVYSEQIKTHNFREQKIGFFVVVTNMYIRTAMYSCIRVGAVLFLCCFRFAFFIVFVD